MTDKKLSTDDNLTTDNTLEDIYFMETQVSDGVHGRVFKGMDRESPKKQLAIKEIFLPAVDPGDLEEMNMRFALEGGALSVVDCEGFPKIRKFMVENDSAYLISDWVDGENLEEILRKNRGPLPVFDVLTIMLQTAGILKVLHSEKYKIIHGDIKPVNLKVPYPGMIALVDIGSQEILKRYPRENYIVPGEFSAPEAFQGKPGFPSDIYSLFAVGHYMLCGVNPGSFPPFSLPPIENLNSNVNDRVGDFFMQGLSYYREHRYKTIAEMINDLEICMRLVPTDSLYADRFNCPRCSSVLPQGVRICSKCSLDFGVYDGTDNPDNYIRRGKEYLKKGRVIRADRCFYQAARLGFESAELFTLIARCRYLAGEEHLAKGMLINLKEKFQSSSLPCLELAKLYRKESREAEAADMLKYVEKNYPENISLQLFNIEEFIKEKDYKKAYELVGEVLKQHPHDRDAMELKGKIIKKTGRRNLLAEYLLEQEELTRTAGMELDLALYYRGKGETNNAFRSLVQAVTKDSDNPATRLRISIALKEMGMAGYACKTMVETLPFADGDPVYFRKAAYLLLEEGEFLDALPFLHYIYTNHRDDGRNEQFAGDILELLKTTKPKEENEPVKKKVEEYCRLLMGRDPSTSSG